MCVYTRRMPETQLIRKQTKIMVSASGHRKTKEKHKFRIDESIIHAFSVSKIFISTTAIVFYTDNNEYAWVFQYLRT